MGVPPPAGSDQTKKYYVFGLGSVFHGSPQYKHWAQLYDAYVKEIEAVRARYRTLGLDIDWQEPNTPEPHRRAKKPGKKPKK